MDVLTTEGMRSLEDAAIRSGQVTGLVLMERAGKGAVDAILEYWPEQDTPLQCREKAGAMSPTHKTGNSTRKPSSLVLCGPGNNGGDGFVVARLLAERGWDINVAHLGDPQKMPQDAFENFRRWSLIGDVAPIQAVLDGRLQSGNHDVVVDALFGIGLRRPLCGPASEIAELLAQPEGRPRAGIAAIDIPSGLDADTGEIPGDGMPVVDARDHLGRDRPANAVNAICADLTVTFHSPKPGHFSGLGPQLSGKLVVCDIGL